MSNEINRRLHRHLKQHAAKRHYHQLHAASGEIYRELYVVGDPAERAELLNRMATAGRQIAKAHPAAYGAVDADAGVDAVATSIKAGAELVHLLAITEEMLARPDADGPGKHLEEHLADLPGHEADLWWGLGLTPDRRRRAEMIERLSDVATVRVGGQAAESLYDLADAERALALAAATGTPASKPPAMPRRETIVAALLAVAVLVAGPLVPGFPARSVLGLYGLAALLAAGWLAVRAVVRVVRKRAAK